MKLALAATAALALIASACSNSATSKTITADHFFDNYKTVVASAPKDGYTPYWLGRAFTAGSITFTGPNTADFADEVTGGGVRMRYVSQPSVGHPDGVGTLLLTVYDPAAWEQARSTQDAPATKFVHVAGQEAKLSAVAGGTRPVASLLIQLKFGDTTVVVTAQSGGSPTPGAPDINPLIDEATFISVMQNLRPYPQ